LLDSLLHYEILCLYIIQQLFLFLEFFVEIIKLLDRLDLLLNQHVLIKVFLESQFVHFADISEFF